MKKIPVAAILIILQFAMIVQAQIESPPFEVTTIMSVPHLSAGDRNIGIEFNVQNNQDTSFSNVRAYLFLQYPFSASISPNNKLGELSNPGYLIASGGSGNEYTQYFSISPFGSLRTVFKIDVDRNAKYGNYDLPYAVYYDDKEFRGKITLAIKGDTLIEIKKASAESKDLYIEPGGTFKFNMVIENVGDNEIKWLKLKLMPRDKELIPLLSDSEVIFKDLPQGSNNWTEIWFSIDRDALAKNYALDLVLNYMDERGTEYNETRLVGVTVMGRANMDIAKKTLEPARVIDDQPFTLTVKIENTGTGDAKGVTVNLEPDLKGDTLAYLGEIKKDDYSNAIFSLDGAKSGNQAAVLRISYEDDTGKHEVSKNVIIIVNPAESQNPFPLLIIAFVVITGVFVWKRRKH